MAEEGRPTKLNDDVVKKLEEVFAMDGTVEEACFYAGIARQTYYNWVKDNPSLLDRFDDLRQRPVLKARTTIINALDDPDIAFKYIERKRRKEFAPPSQNVELSGEITKKIISVDE